MRPYRLLYLVFTLIALPVAAQNEAAQAPEEPAPTPAPSAVVVRQNLPERSSQMAVSLMARIPASEQAQLTTPTESFLALWQVAHSANVQRVVILLPGADQHADQPGVIQPLRYALPKHGWHTLSLMLPDPFDPLPIRQAVPVLVKTDPQEKPDESIPSPATADETAQAPIEQLQEDQDEPQTAPAPASKTTPDNRDQYAEHMFDRIDAALAFVKTQRITEVVLLGQGTGAYWSARYVKNRTPKDVTRLVWIDAQEAKAMEPTLDALLTELKQPVADISLFAPAHTRKAQALRLNYQGYRAITVSPLADTKANQEHVVRRVRGWLDPKS